MASNYMTDDRSDTLLSKVPEVTLYFWIIKVLCTTVGETAADFLNVNINFGLSGALASRGSPTHNPSQRCVIFSQNSRSFLLEARSARLLHWLICSWKKSALRSIAIPKRPRSGAPQERNVCALLIVPAKS